MMGQPNPEPLLRLSDVGLPDMELLEFQLTVSGHPMMDQEANVKVSPVSTLAVNLHSLLPHTSAGNRDGK